jgi:hypothetical protein
MMRIHWVLGYALILDPIKAIFSKWGLEVGQDQPMVGDWTGVLDDLKIV